MIKEEELVKTGQFVKPHGIKGEISLLTDYDISDISGDLYFVCEMDGILVPFFVDSYRQKSNVTALVKFENIDSGENVKLLAGKTAYLPLTMVPAAEDDDKINRNQITGYSVIDKYYGTLGQVKDIDDSTMNILLKVEYKENEILIPVALVTVTDHKMRTMEVALPEGFLEI